MLRLLHRALEFPVVFELQQKFANDYENVGVEFAPYLEGNSRAILDVGCSTGTCAGRFIDMNKHRYTGIDINPNYVKRAQLRYPGGTFISMDATRMTFADEAFDLALFVGVLHHMDNYLGRACVVEARRVVKKGGHILVAEPVFTDGMWLSTALLKMDRGEHIRSTEGYRALFQDVEVERQGNFALSYHRFCSFVLRP